MYKIVVKGGNDRDYFPVSFVTKKSAETIKEWLNTHGTTKYQIVFRGSS